MLKNDKPNDDWTRSHERFAFGALVAFLLAPVIAQGLWRPMAHVFGAPGSSGRITGASLVISAGIVLAQRVRPGRTPLPSMAVGGLVALAASVGLSLGRSGLLALLSVAVAISLLVKWLFPRLPSALDGLARRHKVLTALYVPLALVALVSTARVSIFIGDPTRVEHSAIPGIAFLETHSCLTAYVRADTLSRQRVQNIYDTRWYHGSDGLPPLPEGVENPYRPFNLDYYAYPPPFLLVMAPLAPFEGDYPAQRALWFGLNGLLLAAGLWIVARWNNGRNAHRALVLAPIFFGSLPVLATLQIGNFQIAVVMISVLAMVAFHRERPMTGGALLAFAILSKLTPGVFGIVLLAQRRWRGAAWTAGFGVLLLGLAVLTQGVGPTKSFVTYALPRMSSGEAFFFMTERPFSILTNMAPFGLPFKLQLLGLHVGEPWVLARRIGRLYSALLIVLTVAAVRRPGDRCSQALTWMSLLVLAAVQSPFAPGYTCLGLLWATTLLATEVSSLRGGIALGLLWFFITFVPPGLSLPALTLHSLFQSAVILAVPLGLIVRAARRPVSVVGEPR